MPTPDEVKAALEPLAIRARRFEITIEAVRFEEPEGFITARLVAFESDEGAAVRSIKEQELRVPLPLFDDLERLRAFALGHGEALRVVFESADANIECLMPHDLLHPRVLELARPRLPDEFTRALLTKKRLGKLLRD